MTVQRQRNVHVAFGRDVSAWIRAEAERRKVRPQVLSAAIMQGVRLGGLLDGVLDEDDPRQLAGGHARDVATGLTLLQEGIVYLVGLHADRNGLCHFSTFRFAEHLSTRRGAPVALTSVNQALAALAHKGLIAKGTKRSTGGVQPLRLTPAGAALFETLAGHQDGGGEG